jgi:ABC-type polar amino acid transport system ATPase subunit
MIKVDALTKTHRGATSPVLRGVTFDVGASALGAVLGMSGAGKSTLLRCIVGLETFDGGTIGLGEETISAGKSAALLGRVGLVFQSIELFPHLSVVENCMLAPVRVRNRPRAEAADRALALLAELGLADKANEFPDYLSGGQRQRVAIARALAMEPRVLLYDEPTSALDPSLKREVADTLRRVRGTGVTQIVVTHDVWLAREAADAIFILDAGKIVESGAPAKVLDSPTEEATKKLLDGKR